MSQPSIIGARLLAHARLCREIANATLNEETASKLERMAQDCVQAARDARSGGRGPNVPQPGPEPFGKFLIVFLNCPPFLG